MIRAWKHILRSERGSVMPLIGLGMFMLVGATGVAVDLGRQEIVESRMQNALDSAGLAAGTAPSGANLSTVVNSYFYANFPSNYLGVTISTLTITPNAAGNVLTLNAAGTLNTTFMNVFGIKTMNVSATSQITKQSEGMELVLVLDNTGSMMAPVDSGNSSTNKITALKSAANELLSILYGGNNTVQNLWVGVVPFTQAVNIGTGYSSWMSTSYDSALDFGPTMSGSTCQRYTGNSTTLSGGENADGAAATGVITFSSNPANGKDIVLNGVTWTFVSGTASGNETKIGANLSATLTSLASNLNSSGNASIKTAAYYATSTMLEITYKTTGTTGNAYGLGAGTAPAVVTTPSSAGNYSSSTCAYTLNGNGAATSFIEMNNWAGCVMARPSPYDITDDPPTTSLFDAYDYPPIPTSGSNYNPWVTISTSRSSPYTTTTTYSYAYQSSDYGYYGPNMFCPSPVQPMVAEESTVTTAINNMVAGGDTDLDLGMVWGWRLLSPSWQGLWGGEMSSNGLPLNYSTPNMQKVVVFMTDGMDRFVPGDYSGYGFLADDQLGSTSELTAEETLDTRFLDVCTAMKNKGIIIYTIGFGQANYDSPATESDRGDDLLVDVPLLTSCATDANHFFLAPTNAQLETAFEQIGNTLSNLYISH